jgi:hypothetical protein
MDAGVATIAAALIAGIASIAVAIINNNLASQKENTEEDRVGVARSIEANLPPATAYSSEERRSYSILEAITACLLFLIIIFFISGANIFHPIMMGFELLFWVLLVTSLTVRMNKRR